MAQKFTVKRGDTSPSLQYNLQPAVSLGGASVVFNMSLRSTGAVVINRAPATIVADGVVRYDWQPGDSDVAGTYLAEFEVTYSDSGVETFPNEGFIVVVVTDDIA